MSWKQQMASALFIFIFTFIRVRGAFLDVSVQTGLYKRKYDVDTEKEDYVEVYPDYIICFIGFQEFRAV